MSKFSKLLFYPLLITSQFIIADILPYPKNSGDILVGNKPSPIQYTFAKEEDTLLDIARTFNMGQNEILMANPKVDRWLPGKNTKVNIPISRLLPDTPHNGLVLNLPEFRLYYYPKQKNNRPRTVITHPISIGRVDWETPLGDTTVIAKNKDPVWIPTQAIKDEHATEGGSLPNVFPAGPDNPLGQYAIRLGVPGYLIHSTNKPFGVGMRVSHGCIRMYPEDIELLFPKIKKGLKVHIVNQPIKVGWSDNTLYIEVHPNLDDKKTSYNDRLDIALNLIEQANNYKVLTIKGGVLKRALTISNGIPVALAKRDAL
ncbi:MAG: L,D-transpeptidase family protein [Methylococcaceae bacterium]|nr:L,D-transpeptidase family protein [Methylococcaceae bacterium]